MYVKRSFVEKLAGVMFALFSVTLVLVIRMVIVVFVFLRGSNNKIIIALIERSTSGCQASSAAQNIIVAG